MEAPAGSAEVPVGFTAVTTIIPRMGIRLCSALEEDPITAAVSAA